MSQVQRSRLEPHASSIVSMTASSSVAYAPHTAEKGVAIASKVGFQMRRTVATTEAGLSNCWCILTTRTESGGSAALGSGSQREAPMRPPALRRGSGVGRRRKCAAALARRA